MEGLEGEFGAALVGGAGGEDSAVGEGREGKLAAHFHFLLGVAIEVVLAGELNAGAVGSEGLDDDFALEFAAPGAPGDLGDELKGALAGAEVRDVEAEVCVKDSHQGDVGKMEAFGDHLGADEDVDFLGFEFAEDVLEGVFAAHGIGIDAGEFCFGEDFLEDFLDFLGAVALEGDAGVFAFWAFFGDDGLVAADVADEAFIGAVVGEGDCAVGALAGVAAAVALERAGEASAVEEEDGLLPFFEALLEGGAESV